MIAEVMIMQKFERSFSKFIDCKEYDQANSALFTLVRLAFQEGWLAAGGEPPKANTSENNSAISPIECD